MLLALRQAHAAFAIVESAQGRPGTVKDAEKGSGPLLAPEVAVLRLYVLYQSVSIMSQFRDDLAKMTHGLSVFTTDDVTAELKQMGAATYRKILDVYPANHPNRLQLALDVISIGSLLEDAPLALKAWANAAEENAEARDMKNLLPGRDRPLADSDMTQWIRDQVGDCLPPEYLSPNPDLTPAHTKEDHDHA
uniref:Protein of unassigned function n=1 Tax=Methylobacterium oryzae CBMB20 TaxID=693986 RepID=A0A088B3C9_9HYPH|nr:protein of unassigned function [Methylobacterium oryzae CBMB20]